MSKGVSTVAVVIALVLGGIAVSYFSGGIPQQFFSGYERVEIIHQYSGDCPAARSPDSSNWARTCEWDNLDAVLIPDTHYEMCCPNTWKGSTIYGCDYEFGSKTIFIEPGMAQSWKTTGDNKCVMYAYVDPSVAVCGDSIVSLGEDCDPPGTRGTCTKDFKPGYKDCTDFCLWGACVVKECTPEEKQCQNDDVYICKSDGSGFELYLDCPKYCEDAKCVACPSGSDCQPGQTADCTTLDGYVGYKECEDSCIWSDCAKKIGVVCKFGETQACGECGIRTCTATGNWGACQPIQSQCGVGYVCQEQ
jgi:hypothetical protein